MVAILGISGPVHEAAACLIIDGRVVSALEQERVSRVKHAPASAPVDAVRYVLAAGGVGLRDLTYVTTGWNGNAADELEWVPAASVTPLSRSLLLSSLGPDLPGGLTYVGVRHHLSHAASAARCSGLSDAAVITVDGRGDRESGAVWLWKGDILESRTSIPVGASLGALYSAATAYAGLPTGSEGSLMALAAFGDPVYAIEEVQLTDEAYTVSNGGAIPRSDGDSRYQNVFVDAVQWWKSRFLEMTGPRQPQRRQIDLTRGSTVPVDDYPGWACDLAASVQAVVERVLTHLARVAMESQGVNDVCLAGGVALNCAANGAISRMSAVNRVWIQPAAHDAGTALGAALEVASRVGDSASFVMEHAALGPSFDDATIEDCVKVTKASHVRISDPADVAAHLLCEGRTVGWFQGAAEFGPRALGSRSILAHPGIPGMKAYVNKNVKRRAGYRPFALSCTRSQASRLFGGDVNSPFMLLAMKVRDTERPLVAEAIHRDGTTRAQVVVPGTLPRYERLLARFEALSGCPAVLNTSFNDESEPIVLTPYDALRTFHSTPLDVLVMGGVLLAKDPRVLAHWGDAQAS